MGEVPDSGLKLRQKFAAYDAAVAFDIKPEPAIEPKGCICGEILRGVKTPADCRFIPQSLLPGKSGRAVHGIIGRQLLRLVPLRRGLNTLLSPLAPCGRELERGAVNSFYYNAHSEATAP